MSPAGTAMDATCAPGSSAFWKHVWRRRPAVYRKFVPMHDIAPFRNNRVQRLCRAGVAARVFVLEGERSDHGVSRLVPDAERAWRIYASYRHSEKLTLLLNSVESADPRLILLQDSFGIPFDWRRDDVVASVSTAGSGIGFHAGREDGFIVQVSGSRRWRIWPPEVVGDDHKRFLLGNDRIEPRMEARPEAFPLIDCRLDPGDALYTPALFAHEGETLEESVSLSLAWGGVSAYHVFAALRGESCERLDLACERQLMALIPDYLDAGARMSLTAAFLNRRFRSLGALRPSAREVEMHVERLVGGSGAAAG